MKKSYKSLLAALMLAIGMPVVAENVDQATGTVDGEVPYTWSFWNDKKDDGALWPNWRVEFTPALDEAPLNVAFNYVFKKGDAVVKTGAANGSGITTAQATSYTGPWTDLEEGDYQMLTTVTIIKAGSTVPIISNFDCPVKVEAAPVAEYNFTFNHTEVVTATSITINYEFVEDEGKTIPDDATYAVRLGIIGSTDQEADTRTGSITFENLNPNTNYTIWTNNPSVTIDGKRYIAKVGNYDVKTAEGAAVGPAANLTYEVVNGSAAQKAQFKYSIALENIDEADVQSYRVWLDKPGNVTIGESDTKEGVIEIDVAEGNVEAWFKGQVTFKDGEETKTINTNPNDTRVVFEKVSDPSIVFPTLGLSVGEPTATGLTTGEIAFTITTDKPELENVTYHVWCETTGNKNVGDMTTADLTGTLQLINLNAGTTTDLWVKVRPIVNGEESSADPTQYPGEAQGYVGLSIDTSAFDDGNTPVMPQITLVASNPVKTGETTGTVDYEVTLSNDKFFDHMEIWCVTNASGSETTLAEIKNTKELKGTLNLEGLVPDKINGLWVKVFIYLTDGQKNAEAVQYPGAAQDYHGLDLDMRTDAITAVEAENDAPVEYFNLQGVRVENPVNGLFIRRQGNNVSKVVIR